MKTKMSQEQKIESLCSKFESMKIENYKDLTILSGQHSNGKPMSCYFIGKRSTNPQNFFYYASEERMIQALNKAKEEADTRESNKNELEKSKSSYSAKNYFQIGSILVSSWGYEQTNIDYYQVVGYFGNTGLITKMISKNYEETGFLSGKSTPKKNCFISQEIRFRTKLASWSKDPLIICESYKFIGKYDGRKMYESHYA